MTIGRRSRVFEDKDVYTTSSTGNILPATADTLYLNSLFPRVKTHIIEERNNNDGRGWIKVIEGTWRPGEWSRNTLNDEDIKAWYATGAAPSPAWFEQLVLLGRPDEFIPNGGVNLNIFVELRYHVQFKDKKQTFRYTQSTDATIALNTPADVIQVPNTPNAWGSTL